MDSSFALALVPALAVLFFVAMPALDHPAPARKLRNTGNTTRESTPARRHSERVGA